MSVIISGSSGITLPDSGALSTSIGDAINITSGYVSGIQLGGTGAANKLEDYESGDWTPTIVGGTLTITTINKASYIKVGNIVHISIYISLANNGNSTDMTFGGLPFAAAAGIYGTGVVTHSLGANSTETLYARANEGASAYMQIYKGKSNGVAQTDVDGGWFITSLSYRV
tara:strand:- start:39 stop:551 length:513 start_codon:yes stop_codon:yes gene_type:complete